MMEKLCIFLLIAIITNEAVGMSLRSKRQTNDDEENNLDDRYGWGWDRPTRPSWRRQPQNQWQNPNRETPWWQRPPQNQWQNPNQPFNPNRPNQNQGQQPTTQRPNGNGSTTQSSAVQACIRNCPTTSEYNPVCGSDNVTYSNPGRLNCARACGVAVGLQRSSPCPATTTAAPS